ncbi:52 kDa repressor of the inhibitor of the protein kinase-like [Aphis craccivora]|uniref:52 kDa repressor of the inhibitor of the protein kinase-like n=1 Tax=Aphis craccivora TaxID=307492 RepID=A0A6G0YWH2_APHCR|nr:52 kDa repressor of the inhibitor of the protein kinase-like [Aphis craccivora]
MYSSVLHDNSPEIWRSELDICDDEKLVNIFQTPLMLSKLYITPMHFQTVHKILRVLSVSPVIAATNVRSFSTLRRLKTYPRTTM